LDDFADGVFSTNKYLGINHILLDGLEINYELNTVKVSFLARDRERDREREFFLVYFFITIILVYVRNIHGDGTVRYAHDHAPRTKLSL
jgi:hypothetical protein